MTVDPKHMTGALLLGPIRDYLDPVDRGALEGIPGIFPRRDSIELRWFVNRTHQGAKWYDDKHHLPSAMGDPDYKWMITTTTLYNDYVKWCDKHGLTPCKTTVFSQRLNYFGSGAMKVPLEGSTQKVWIRRLPLIEEGEK